MVIYINNQRFFGNTIKPKEVGLKKASSVLLNAPTAVYCQVPVLEVCTIIKQVLGLKVDPVSIRIDDLLKFFKREGFEGVEEMVRGDEQMLRAFFYTLRTKFNFYETFLSKSETEEYNFLLKEEKNLTKVESAKKVEYEKILQGLSFWKEPLVKRKKVNLKLIRETSRYF